MAKSKNRPEPTPPASPQWEPISKLTPVTVGESPHGIDLWVIPQGPNGQDLSEHAFGRFVSGAVYVGDRLQLDFESGAGWANPRESGLLSSHRVTHYRLVDDRPPTATRK
jgi:hypothetical protein